jgi:hydrogenase maturation protease
MRQLVLGLGNDIFGDDAIGLRVIESLACRPGLEGFDFQTADSGGVGLLDVLSGYEKAFIVDCIPAAEGSSGEVSHLRPEELCCQPLTLSSHYCGLPEVLAIGERLDIPMPEIEILAISVNDPFWIREGLSPEMESALPFIVEQIESFLLETSKCMNTVWRKI